MHIVRYLMPGTDGAPQLGVRNEEGIRRLPVESLAELLHLSVLEIQDVVGQASGPRIDAPSVVMLPPVDGRMEVWAAGVTYARSREARMEESDTADVYERVYEAERPELFFKAAAWRVVTDNEPIAIRRDSPLNVPEAELAVVLNASGEIVGFTVSNDVSSRTIEGENPLYLPQAKVYAGSCALGTGIKPVWEVNAVGLDIELEVHNDAGLVWSASTSTAQMRRSPEELVEYMFREEQFPDGAVLSTGTGIVPEMSFTLAVGDMVHIRIAGIGAMTNSVVLGKSSFSWLCSPGERPSTVSERQ
jgi:2-dehydro-3-deoxy-D-arabinonate dehydratase